MKMAKVERFLLELRVRCLLLILNLEVSILMLEIRFRLRFFPLKVLPLLLINTQRSLPNFERNVINSRVKTSL